jgi:hypothetical protein
VSNKCTAAIIVHDDVTRASPAPERDEMSLLHFPMRPFFAARSYDEHRWELLKRCLCVESRS